MDTFQNDDFRKLKKIASRLEMAMVAYDKMQPPVFTDRKREEWDIRLVQHKAANAWCLPGYHIALFTGLFPITQSEASLAVMLSHVIAHEKLKHGNDRMKKYLLDKLDRKPLDESLLVWPNETIELFRAAYGMDREGGIWPPFSEKQEIKADQLGLQLCALAGYHPREGLVFWERMSGLSYGPRMPELVYSHPVTEERINKMNYMMDDLVKNHYKPIK